MGWLPSEGSLPGVRALSPDEELVVASPRERREWVATEVHADASRLSAGERQALARMWLAVALFEHASIASCSRFALQLMAVGAPPMLLEEAQQAALDEVRHATAAFALASAYRGTPVGPSRLPLPERMSLDASLEALAVSTSIEACVDKTLAVLIAVEQLAHATDAAVRAVLETTIDDASRHAELGWCTVRWAMKSGGPRVRAAVRRALDEAQPTSRLRWSAPLECAADVNRATLQQHGWLDETARREVMERGFEEVVQPCVRALFELPYKVPAPLPMGV